MPPTAAAHAAGDRWLRRIAALDAFPKFERNISQASGSGGVLSLLVYALMAYLIATEIAEFNRTHEEYEFVVDNEPVNTGVLAQLDAAGDGARLSAQDLARDAAERSAFQLAFFGPQQRLMQDVESPKTHHLRMSLDLVVAMACDSITVTLVDVAGQVSPIRRNFSLISMLLEPGQGPSLAPVPVSHDSAPAPVAPELATNGPAGVRQILREAINVARHRAEKQAAAEAAMSSDIASHVNASEADSNPKIGCRISGELMLNKVSGRVQFSSPGHGVSAGVLHSDHKTMNFSHIINRLSFGAALDAPVAASVLQSPLDHTHVAAAGRMDMIQYFLSPVPTTLSDEFTGQVAHTYQYAAKVHRRSLDEHNAGNSDSGVPGIVFQYDIESIRVRIAARGQRLAETFVRICSVAGGTFVTVGLIHSLVLLALARWWHSRRDAGSRGAPLYVSIGAGSPGSDSVGTASALSPTDAPMDSVHSESTESDDDNVGSGAAAFPRPWVPSRGVGRSSRSSPGSSAFRSPDRMSFSSVTSSATAIDGRSPPLVPATTHFASSRAPPSPTRQSPSPQVRPGATPVSPPFPASPPRWSGGLSSKPANPPQPPQAPQANR